MKANHIALICLPMLTLSAYANQQENLPTPNLPDYMAQPAPRPPISQQVRDVIPVPNGFYIRAGVLYSSIDISDISHDGPTFANAITPTVAKTSADDTGLGGTIAFGYNLSQWIKIPSRVEVEYDYRSEVDYNANPALLGTNVTPQSFDGTFQNQTVFANLYYDLNWNWRVRPFVGGGAGFAINKSDGTAKSGNISKSTSETDTSFAWNIRAGLRIALNKAWMLGATYEYADLGKAEWNLISDPGSSNSLKSEDIKTNEVMAGITWNAT